jgi:hypothetical protein
LTLTQAQILLLFLTHICEPGDGPEHDRKNRLFYFDRVRIRVRVRARVRVGIRVRVRVRVRVGIRIRV